MKKISLLVFLSVFGFSAFAQTAITGDSTLCAGSTASLSNSTAGGTWSSSNTAVATIGSASGIYTGVSAGTAVISYVYSGGTATTVVTVNAAPSAGTITGPADLCYGSSITLSSTVSGGTWSSGTPSVATVDGVGVVSGVYTGPAMITYTVGGGSGCSGTATKNVTVITTPFVPASISGIDFVCVGGVGELWTSVGGSWISSDTGIATISDVGGFGLFSGVAPGTATISFTATNSCGSSVLTREVTVNPLPAPITGAAPISIGSTITLATASATSPYDGYWMTGTPEIATVETWNGIVSGVSAGSAIISYRTIWGCVASTIVTVEGAPPIVGTTSVCSGASATLSHATTGGAWSSSNTAVATIGSASGIYTGVSAGTAVISYVYSGGTATTVVTVNAASGTITGLADLCNGSTSTLSNSTGGGVWSSAAPGIATVGTNGVVTGVSHGTTIISYSVAGCMATKVVTVHTTPVVPAITGPSTVCAGSTITVGNTEGSGVWTSSDPSVFSITGSGSPGGGVVTGVAAGAATIIYAVTDMGEGYCTTTVTKTITVSPSTLPAITGAPTLCVGGTRVLSNTTASGSWSSGNLAVATVNSSGIVSGVAAGTATISYSVSTSCGTSTATRIVTVYAIPNAGTITGTRFVCAGGAIILSDAVTGGVWSTNAPLIATVNSSGVVSGVAGGTVSVYYTVTNGCTSSIAMKVITVSTTAGIGAISGTPDLCLGEIGPLFNSVDSGVWTSSAPGVATVNFFGMVTAVSPGTAIISYTANNGCGPATATRVATINATPNAGTITGSSTVNVAATITLTNAVSGGTWSSASTGIATVNSLGVVTGLAAGTAVISYVVVNGCGTATATKVITVSPATGVAVSGDSIVCAGSTTSLTANVAGGAWSSSNATKATVSAAGVVTGVAAGTAIISYNISGVIATAVVTVNAAPAAITGTAGICAGATTTLGNIVAGGAWSGSESGIATVGSTGVVTGLIAGTTTISYTLANGCRKTIVATVNATPGAITGTASVCSGSVTTLSNSLAGGTWSSGNVAVATVGTAGNVTGAAAATTLISYTYGTCRVTRAVTVLPVPAAIGGVAKACQGTTTTLSNITVGGAWSSSDAGIATVGGTGVLTGVVAGTTNIIYTLPNTCSKSVVATINPNPAGITGVPSVCVGATTSLASATTGALLWSSSDLSKASVSSTGVVTGIAAGTSKITYKITSGCFTTAVVTVNALPATITGTLTVCSGGITTLANTVAGGTWSSSNTGRATVGAATGIVTGVAAGTVNIIYTIASGCNRSVVLTVNATPPAITGSTTLCGLTTSSLSNALPGGTWSSRSTGVASVSASGVLTAVSPVADTVSVFYTMPVSGCRNSTLVTIKEHPAILYLTGCGAALCPGELAYYAHTTTVGTWTSSNPGVVTVAPDGGLHALVPGSTIITLTTPEGCSDTEPLTIPVPPPPISGALNVCTGRTTTLGNAMTGGTWSSSTPAVASLVGGAVTGLAAGTCRITYTASNTCTTETVVSVNTTPSTITGTLTACTGTTTTLANTLAGGIWTSSNTSVATVGASTGIVTAVAAGTAVISYTTSAGCSKSVVVTINATPTIAGTRTVCVGKTTALTSTPLAYAWSSGSTSTATVLGGIVTGVAGGTAIITVTAATGCKAMTTVTVNALPPAMAGMQAVCAGSATSLSNAMAGGSWSSSAVAIGTVGTSGVVSGLLAGVTTISYTSAAGCLRTAVVTVNALPTITGTASVCVGTAATLVGAVGGGTWSSLGSAIATVGSAGIVTGASSGTATIDYTLSNGCKKTTIATVNVTPGAITGTASVCSGTVTTLSNSLAGGTWSSGNITVATVGTTGIVTGAAANTTLISYTYGTCRATRAVTVLAVPVAIGGVAKACPGTTAALSNGVVGGAWSSSNTGIATVGATGVLTGVVAGTANIIYTLPNSCSKSVVATINPNPASITGTKSVCAGATTSLANATTGLLSWSSSDLSKASVSSIGVVTGVAAGTSNITYKIISGCYSTAVVTVNGLPAAITGALTACPGTTTTLTNTVTGGTWASNNTSTATVGASAGIVTGVTAGTAVISYTTSAGCSRSVVVTINATPTIGGTRTVCVGKTTTITSTPLASAWASSSITNATVSGGIVTGVAGGTAIITVTVATGCKAMATVTVNALPPTMTGVQTVCAGSTTSLSNAVTGGTWSSSAVTIGTVGTSGVVTGLLAGVTTISYTSAAGCLRTAVVTVNALPAIAGTASVCVGTAATLSGIVGGGTWSSLSSAIAAIGATGIVTGVSSGTATIDYTLSNGCKKAAIATVNVTPGAITGTASVCAGTATTLGNSLAGGTWSSGNVAVATVGTTGVVTGAAANITLISYTYGTCRATRAVTVLAVPVAIGGVAKACPGTTAALSNGIVGGAWSSSNTGIVTVGTTGVLTGVVAGTANIIYTLPNSCSKSVVATINPNPASITGTKAVCAGSTTTLANATTGLLSWSSSDLSKASVASTGVVTGVAAGTSQITYKVTSGCFTTAVVTVNAMPASIAGTLTACSGMTTTLADATTGGTWTSGSASVAMINASGVVTGLTGGTSVISYSFPTGCSKTTIVTINQSPAAIAGTATVCKTATTSLSTTGTGSWSSLNPTIASVSSTGVVSGVNSGTGIIVFTATNGCKATQAVTVNICGSRAIATGVTATELDAQIAIFPNPTSGMLTINTPESGTLHVSALDGKEVVRYDIAKGNTNIVLPAELAAGVYMCRFNGAEGAHVIVRLIYQPQ